MFVKILMKEPNVECLFCNKPFYKGSARLKRHPKSFCSRECSQNYNKSFSTKQKYNCNKCNKEVYRTKNQVRNSKTGLIFCSNTCKNTYIATNRRWEYDKEGNAVSRSPKSHKSRVAYILERDSYTCRDIDCRYSDDKRMLDIHHKDENPLNNNFDNLITLCVWCHVAYHRGVKELKLNNPDVAP